MTDINAAGSDIGAERDGNSCLQCCPNSNIMKEYNTCALVKSLLATEYYWLQ